ncbi:hypothetical protein BDV12DRAFT_179007 [Aspergillus spectabilis]
MNSTRLRPHLPFRSLPRPRASHPHRSQPHSHPHNCQRTYSTRTPSLPKIAQPSFWTSLMPKFLRSPSSSSSSSSSPSPKSTEWNPASFYIIIFILIGSQAIRMIALKNEYTAYNRSTEAKIRLLREVIEKVKAGEEVNVERLLGRGEEGVEREWEEVLREIEQEDSLWHQKQKAKRNKAAEEERAEAESVAKTKVETQASQGKDYIVSSTVTSTGDESAKEAQPKRRAGFF